MSDPQPKGIDGLVAALHVFRKYGNPSYPTHCEHDVLMVVGFSREEIAAQDADALEALGFSWSDECDCWASYRYGSA